MNGDGEHTQIQISDGGAADHDEHEEFSEIMIHQGKHIVNYSST